MHARHHCVMSWFNHIAPSFQGLSSFLTSRNTLTHLQNMFLAGVEVFISVKSISVIFYHHFLYIFQPFAAPALHLSSIYSEGTNVEDLCF